jgi:hypothetical protein
MPDDIDLSAGVIKEPSRRQPPAAPPDYDEIINRHAQRTQLDPELIRGVMQQESGGNTRALSPKGARGPMQLMPATAARFNVRNPNDPEEAVRGGADYLKFLSDRYKGNRNLILAGYNAGEGAVDKFGGVPPYRETRNYVQQISQRLNKGMNLDAGLEPSPQQPPQQKQQKIDLSAGLEDSGQTPPSQKLSVNPPNPTATSSPVNSRQPSVPNVTSTAKPYEPPPIQPLKFEPDTVREAARAAGVNALGRGSLAIANDVAMQGMKLPANHPDLAGKPVTLKFKQPPTAEDISDEFLRTYGGEGYADLGAQFKQQTGGLLAHLNAEAKPKQEGGGYTVTIRPTRGAIDAINAYAQKGGDLDALRKTLELQQLARGNVARDVKTELAKSPTRQDLQKAGAESLLSTAQFGQNLKNLNTGTEPAEDISAQAIQRARQALPETKTTAGELASTATSIPTTMLQAEALGPMGKAAFPAQQFVESANLGPAEAAKRAGLAIPLVATGPIAKAAGIDALSPVQRQIVTRALAGYGMGATTAATGGSPADILKSFGFGGAFPIGGRGQEAEGQESPVPNQRDVEAVRRFGARLERVMKIEQTERDREAIRQQLGDVNEGQVEAQPNVTAQPEAAGVPPELLRPEVGQGSQSTVARNTGVPEKVEPIKPNVGEAVEEPRLTSAASPEDVGASGQSIPQIPAASPTVEASKDAQVVKPWEMTRDQVEEEFQRRKSDDSNIEASIFGPEQARKYERLQRTANSSTATRERADAASAEIERMEAALSERDRNKLYGIGETGLQLEDLAQYRQSLGNLDDHDPQSLAQSMRFAVSRVGKETDPTKMTQEQQIAYGTLREAARIAHENGWDTQEISRNAVKAAAGRFSDPKDAAFMLDRFLKKEPAAQAPTRQALPPAPSEGEVPKPEVLESQPEVKWRVPQTEVPLTPKERELLDWAEDGAKDVLTDEDWLRDNPDAGTAAGQVEDVRQRLVDQAPDVFEGAGNKRVIGSLINKLKQSGYFEPKSETAESQPEGRVKGESTSKVAAPDFIQSENTSNQAREGVAKGAAPSSSSEGVPVKTAAIEAERALAGLNPIEKQQYRNIPQSFMAGKKAVESGSIDPRKLAAEVDKTERPLTDAETGALGYDRSRLANDFDDKIAELNKAIDAKDAQGIAAHRAALDEIQRLADINDSALEKGGREQSIAFNARKMLVGRNYQLLPVLQRIKAARGSEVPNDVVQRVTALTKELKLANEKIADYESQKGIGGVRRFIADSEREIRKQGRSAKKEVLDQEFAQLSQQFRAKMSGVQPSGIDPSLIPIITKMARNRVQSGINTVDGLVDAIHSELKDYIDDKREIRDAFSGYGQEAKPRTKDDITEELGRLKREARKVSKEEDRNPQTEAAKQEASKQKAVKTRLNKQIADLENQLKTGDFSKKARPKLEYDRDAEQLLAHRDLLKDRIEREIAKQKKPLPEDYLTWWQQGTILSGTRTLAKLGSYAAGKNVIIPIEDVVSGAMSHVPGLRGLSEASPRYGGGIRENIQAQGAAFKEFVHKAMYRDAWTSLKEGTNALKLKHGDNRYQYSPRLLTFVRGLHMAEKVFASRPEYYRSIEKEAQWAIRNGLNPQDPKVQSQILARSYMNGLRAQLMQPNIPSKILSTTNQWLESVGRTNKIGQIQEPVVGYAARAIRTGIRTLFPITRVPFNYANEALSYNPVGGAAKGALRIGPEAYRTLRSKGFGKGVIDLAQQGMSNMPPEAADAAKRALVKGAVGIPFALIGWYNYKNIGGYYQPGQRKEGDVPFGGLRIGGYDIPRALVHNPLFETMHFFATMRRVYEGDKDGGDLTHAAGAALQGTVEETPFLDVPQRIGKAMENKAGVRNMAGDIARSAVVPPDVQRIAAMSDSAEPTTVGQKALQIAGLKDVKTVKRSPQGFGQTFEMGVPGLRQRVPLNERAAKQQRTATLTSQYREGKIARGDLKDMVRQGVLTEAEGGWDTTNQKTGETTHHKGSIEEAGTLSGPAAAFEKAHAATALERFERMSPAQRVEVEDLMKKKAKALIESHSLTDAQKDAFRDRLDKLGISPR